MLNFARAGLTNPAQAGDLSIPCERTSSFELRVANLPPRRSERAYRPGRERVSLVEPDRIDGRKIFDDVALEGITVAARPGLALIQGLVGAFTDPAGEAVMNKTGLPDWLDDLAQGVMRHPVPPHGW